MIIMTVTSGPWQFGTVLGEGPPGAGFNADGQRKSGVMISSYEDKSEWKYMEVYCMQ